jgi:myo-inositol-1(or 4)-monophosphatase
MPQDQARPAAPVLDTLDLDAALDAALDAVRAGCVVLAQGRPRLSRLRVTHKSPGDLSTEVDQAAEQAILARIRQSYPGHAALGEESGAAGAGPWRWIVDPLDGSVNYVRGLPYYAVSVALEREGEILLGVVADPVRKEFFTAIRGRGAWLGGKPLRVSGRERLEEAVVGAVVPPPGSPLLEACLERFCAVARRAAGVRRAGAAALDLAYVAAGRLDGFFVLSLRRWDIAAGVLLVQEAGGVVANLDGNPEPLATDRIAAGSPGLVPHLVRLVAFPTAG